MRNLNFFLIAVLFVGVAMFATPAFCGPTDGYTGAYRTDLEAVENIKAGGDLLVVDDASIGDDLTVGGDLAVTGTITGAGFTPGGDISLVDNDKLIFGTGTDIYNYFDATNLKWTDGTNDLLILTDGGTTGTLALLDNCKLLFGTGSDAYMYWDASNLVTTDGTNTLSTLTDNGTTGTLTLTGNIVSDNVATGTSELKIATIELTNSEIINLAATPKELVAAPGAGFILELDTIWLILDYGSEVFTESDDDLLVQYATSDVAVTASIEATGFIDQAVDQVAYYLGIGIPTDAASDIANNALELINDSGEYAGNASLDSTMTVKVTYRVHATGL